MAIGRLQPESPSKPIASTLGDIDSTRTTGRPCLVVPDYCGVRSVRRERSETRLSKRLRHRELNQAGCKTGVHGIGSAEPARSNRRGRDVCGACSWGARTNFWIFSVRLKPRRRETVSCGTRFATWGLGGSPRRTPGHSLRRQVNQSVRRSCLPSSRARRREGDAGWGRGRKLTSGGRTRRSSSSCSSTAGRRSAGAAGPAVPSRPPGSPFRPVESPSSAESAECRSTE